MEVLTVKDAAALLEVDGKTVYRLIGAGGFPAFKVGRQWRVRLSDLQRWIDRQVRANEASGTYQVSQTSLFAGPEAEEEEGSKTNGKVAFSDSAFSENADLPVHNWAPWIAGFSARFVEDVLEHFIGQPKTCGQYTVLDPFAGVGTTLVAAMLQGHHVCGFEINPYAAEVCQLKLSVWGIPSDRLSETIERFESQVGQAVRAGREPVSRPPRGFVTRSPFFSPAVERKVLLVADFLATIEDEDVRRCFRIAFASEVVGFSNYSYEPSLCRRRSAGKRDVLDANVVQRIARKLHRMHDDIRVTRAGWKLGPVHPEGQLFAGSFFKHGTALPSASVDVVVTSPPYLNNYHYIRNSRPQVYWLGLVDAPGDLKQVEEDSFGKYWQTVRGQEAITLDFSMPRIEEALEVLRERNPEKGQYGGAGWANYAATYFNDSQRLARSLVRLLKPGGRAVVVLGNSILQGVEFKTDEIFGQICEANGLRVTDVQLLRKKRTGASIINSSVRTSTVPKRTTLYESAVMLEKP